MTEPVLGIWDGHDAGAALVLGEEILCAVNEERLTRRKLEVGFPAQAIGACLASAGLAAGDVRHVAFSTTDVAKTLTRVLPGLKERYYQVRRRKRLPGPMPGLKRWLKYRLTEIPGNRLTAAISARTLRTGLRGMGLTDFKLYGFDHHQAHAAAVFFSGFNEAVVVTIDGIGDGRSGIVCDFHNGDLRLVAESPGCASLGLFFEQVTHLLNLRELEDEGKVMALADFAPQGGAGENPLAGLVQVDGGALVITSGTGHRCSQAALYRRLRDIHWGHSNEQFAAWAQQVLEEGVEQLVAQAVALTGRRRVVLAGGVASNVKANRRVRLRPEVDDLFVFPHMGDGGLALGAAALANRQLHGLMRYRFEDHLALGPACSPHAGALSSQMGGLDALLENCPFRVQHCQEIEQEAARLIAAGEILLWVQGAMEYGPRALGGRSILARPDRPELRDRLNLVLKRRAWYQPFCPSILAADAALLLDDYGKCSPDRFMTSAYRVRADQRQRLAGVISIDGTCRPQILSGEETLYKRLLHQVKALTGTGAVLNTSLNRHGEPLVNTPEQALAVFAQTDCGYLVIGDVLVSKPAAPERNGRNVSEV